jgi:hypothetical protein
VALLLYTSLVFASALGIEHNLLIYGASPAWWYTEMRGFADSIAPWLWFKLYWAAWALLLALAARLLRVRGREGGLGARLRLARRRVTRSTAGVAAAAVALIVTSGGFIFYNTNVLNRYESASETTRRRVEYERRYRRYETIPQPRRAAVDLRVELYPERRAVSIRGSYRLVNQGAVPIDSIHLTTNPQLGVGAITFDRPASGVVVDETHGYRIYALARPLLPGDSLRLDFAARFAPRGFGNAGVTRAVGANATRLPLDQLPVIGYQRQRELRADERPGAAGAPTVAAPAHPALAPRYRGAIRRGPERRGGQHAGAGRRHERGPDRRRTRHASQELDGGWPALLPLCDERSHRERIFGLLREVRGPRGEVERRLHPDLPPSGAHGDARRHAPRRARLARLLHRAVRPVRV